MERKFKKPLAVLFYLLYMTQKLRRKNESFAPVSSKSSKRQYYKLTDPTFITLNVLKNNPTLRLSSKHDLHRGDSLTSQLSTGNFHFKPQLTSLYMVLTP